MPNPAIWLTPANNSIHRKDGTRSYVDGDVIAIPFTFQRSVSKVRFISGTLPYGANGGSTGISGTLTRKDPSKGTPPRDYRVTVRAYSEASGAEIELGVPAEFYEDRTFTIIGGLWYGPAATQIYHGSGETERPLRRGDSVSVPFTFDPGRSLSDIKMIGGELPQGLHFSPTSKRVIGTIEALPKGVTSYSALIRAFTDPAVGPAVFQDRTFTFVVDPIDELHGWKADWLAGLTTFNNTTTGEKVYSLGTVHRGATSSIQLEVDNPDKDQLVYSVTGYTYNSGTWFSGMPVGLSIDRYGRITGEPQSGENLPGDYFFKIYAREPSGTEGEPRTSEIIFHLDLSDEILLDPQLSDIVRWETPAGLLGSTYENYPSHFGVKAVPQFPMGVLANEKQIIQYKVIGSAGLPGSLTLNETSGDMTGHLPYVDTTTVYNFTIRATIVFQNQLTGAIRLSPVFSDRRFSIQVRNLHVVDSVTNLYLAVPPFDRREITQWVFGNKAEFHDSDPRAPNILTILGRDVLFRRADRNWGKIHHPKILLAAGLFVSSPSDLLRKLRDYHTTIKLRLGQVKWAKGYDPVGNYVYDMLYLSVIDPMAGAGGFDAFDRDVILPSPTTQAVPEFNLPENSDRYHPVSIANMRRDLINTKDRLAWGANSENSTHRGVGLAGREALPFWMSCEQIPGKPSSKLGYVPAVELAYLKPGKGAQAVKSLVQAGFEKAIQGHVIKVDRYLMLSDGKAAITFDVNPELDTQTSFDGPDFTTAPTAEPTTFDERMEPTSKYYKFPPGDGSNF